MYLHVIYNYFRKDNIIFVSCICITITGSLLIIIKKYIWGQIIQRIPKSNILPQPKIDREQSTQISTVLSTPQIIPVKPKDTGDLSLFWQSSPFEQKNSFVFPVSFFFLLLKVSKSQKHFFLKLHCPKNRQNIRQKSALAS